jgi:hypothetical protein
LADKQLETLAYRLKDLSSLRNLFSELNFDFADKPVNKDNWNDDQKKLVQEARIIASKDDYQIYYIQTNTDSLKEWKGISSKIIKDNHGLCMICSHNPSGFKWVFSSLSKEFSKSFSETRHVPIDIKPDVGVPKTFVDFLEKIKVDKNSTGTSIVSQISEAFDSFAIQIHDELTVNVFEAIKVLSEGIILDKSNNLTLDEQTLEDIREQVFILLYRIIFILYAEDRGIFPTEQQVYEEKFSFKWLKQEWLLHSDNQKKLSEYNVQERLLGFFRLIELGSEDLGYDSKEFFMRAYYGRLFDRKINSKLDKWKIKNQYLLDAISLLTRTRDKKGNYFFLDYSALETRHLGSIYEHLLEFHLTIEEEKIAELPNPKDRKSSGSYYTPKYVVDHIVKNSIEPLIENIVKNNLEKEIQIEKILSLKILDPAMGSGHFLIGAVEYVATRLCEIEFGEVSELDYIERKRDVVRRCIYGVDINPLSVDLARLSLWLETLSSDKPLSFLSAHLKTGNSLIGTELQSIFEKQTTLFESEKGRSAFKKNVKTFLMFEGLEDDSNTAVKMKIEEYEKMQSKGTIYYDLKFLLDCKIGENFGIKIPNLGDYRAKIGENSLDFYSDDNYQKIKQLSNSMKFFHWELEFPQIFYNENGEKSKSGGFDIVIGNPPYVRVESIEPELADYYKTKFESVYQRCDLFITFIEYGMELLKQNCRLGFIVSNQFFRAEYGEKIREIIVDKYNIENLIDYTNYSPWKKISTYSCILFLSKQKMKKNIATRILSNEAVKQLNKNGLENIKNIKDIQIFEFDFKTLSSEPWVIRPKMELDILKKITNKEFQKIGKYCNISSPLKTGKDSILCGELISKQDNSIVLSFENDGKLTLEKEIWKPLIRPVDIKKWNVNKPKEFVFFPYIENDSKFELISENNFKTKYSQTYNYLSKYKKILLERKDSRLTWAQKKLPWYSLHRLGKPSNHQKNKIVTNSIINSSKFSFDNIGYFVPTGGVLGVAINEIDPYLLLGYLNSKIVLYFLRSISSPKRGGYISLDVGTLSEVSIPVFSSSSKTKISKIVQSILECTEDDQKILELENEMNDEVFNAYDFTNEELDFLKKII